MLSLGYPIHQVYRRIHMILGGGWVIMGKLLNNNSKTINNNCWWVGVHRF